MSKIHPSILVTVNVFVKLVLLNISSFINTVIHFILHFNGFFSFKKSISHPLIQKSIGKSVNNYLCFKTDGNFLFPNMFDDLIICHSCLIFTDFETWKMWVLFSMRAAYISLMFLVVPSRWIIRKNKNAKVSNNEWLHTTCHKS